MKVQEICGSCPQKKVWSLQHNGKWVGLTASIMESGWSLQPAQRDQTYGIFSAFHDHNVPCAVCYASTRAAVTMIPAKTCCPSTWTLEYSGYLMSGNKGHPHATMYECVDKNPDSVPGSVSNTVTDPALFYHIEASCNGMACPPYNPQKELTCAVCTK